MKVIMTAEAYEQYVRNGAGNEGMEAVQRHFEEEMSGGSVMYVRLQGQQAVFLRNAYWLYTIDADQRVMTLTHCLALIQGISRISR